MDFPGDSDGKQSTCNAKDSGSIPGSGRCPGEGNAYPVFLSGEFNAQRRLWATVHGTAKSWTPLMTNTFTFLLRSTEKLFALYSDGDFYS